MEAISIVVGIVIGIVVGFLIATLVLKKATPQQLWDKLMWALDRAEDIPGLRDKAEKFVEEKKGEIEAWLKAPWKN